MSPRRLIVLMAVLAIAPASMQARSVCRHFGTHTGWSVHASWATPSDLSADLFVNGHVGNYRYYGLDVHDIYSDYHGLTLSAGTFSAGVSYKFNRWLSLGADLDLGFLWNERFSAVDDSSKGVGTGVSLMLVPKFRVYYVDRPSWRLYGFIGMGVAKYFGYDKLKGADVDPYSGTREFWDYSLRGALQFVPIGVEFGRRIFGFFETGVGNEYTGVRGGIGYRF